MLCCAMFKLLLNTSYGQCVVCVRVWRGVTLLGSMQAVRHICALSDKACPSHLSRGACVGVCMHARARVCVWVGVYVCTRVCYTIL